MAPHLSAVELDHVQQLLQKGKSPVEIHNSLRRLCGRRKVEPPHPISGRMLWDAPSLIKAYCNNNIFGHPGIDGPPDGFPASGGRVGRGAGFSILGQRLSGMLRPC